MNKRIVAGSILLLMMCAMAASVFAQNTVTEYEYTVTVRYQPKGTTSSNAQKDATYTFYATSQMEAMDIAKRMCEWDNGAGTVISCGIPRETGKSRTR